MYKLLIVAAFLGVAAAKPGILAPVAYTAPLAYSASAVSVAAPAVPVAAPNLPIATPALRVAAPAVSVAAPAVPVAAPAVPVATPALRIAAPAIAAQAIAYSGPAYEPLAYSSYAGPYPYAYNYGYGIETYPSYYWKKCKFGSTIFYVKAQIIVEFNSLMHKRCRDEAWTMSRNVQSKDKSYDWPCNMIMHHSVSRISTNTTMYKLFILAAVLGFAAALPGGLYGYSAPAVAVAAPAVAPLAYSSYAAAPIAYSGYGLGYGAGLGYGYTAGLGYGYGLGGYWKK
ncbi:uncharacterized protein LOC131848061 [Achroia grisella]|uniref:uncharacterized protein LOC131848061 n=1 Tax=Achroia grisella TaxID=688607 RepID=UPI0027D2A8A7|nr:uncharacterized protein LOC131848061 [Achroia grisella]